MRVPTKVVSIPPIRSLKGGPCQPQVTPFRIEMRCTDRLGLCEVYLTLCLDSCKAGGRLQLRIGKGAVSLALVTGAWRIYATRVAFELFDSYSRYPHLLHRGLLFMNFYARVKQG